MQKPCKTQNLKNKTCYIEKIPRTFVLQTISFKDIAKPFIAFDMGHK